MKVKLHAVRGGGDVIKAEFKSLKKNFAEEKPALTPRRPKIKAEKQMLDYWDRKWNLMIAEMKKEIETVIEG